MARWSSFRSRSTSSPLRFYNAVAAPRCLQGQTRRGHFRMMARRERSPQMISVSRRGAPGQRFLGEGERGALDIRLGGPRLENFAPNCPPLRRDRIPTWIHFHAGFGVPCGRKMDGFGERIERSGRWWRERGGVYERDIYSRKKVCTPAATLWRQRRFPSFWL